MNATELDRRARTYDGWVPPELVSLLIEHGHVDEVRVQAQGGDWYCARGWAQVLIERDQQDAALAVLAPFVDAGWSKAARSVADLLDGWGRGDEAIALLRPHAGDRLALPDLAKLLSRHDRTAEAFDLLYPHTKDWFLAQALVDVTAGTDRDEEVAHLLEAYVADVHRFEAEPWNAEPSNAVDLLATVRERQGRIDEAIALLHTRHVGVVNNRDQLADLLVRHGRHDELREYVAGEGGEAAAYCLAELLEERGDVEGAVEVLRPLADGSPNAAFALAELLARHGRADEAIEVLRPVPRSMGGDPEWVVRKLGTLLADEGRLDEALAFIDAFDGRSWELAYERAWLLSYCGRTDEAVTELRAHPEAATWYGAWLISGLLADAGRLDEAIEVLRTGSDAGTNATALAELLIRQGHVKDAMTALHQRTTVVPSWTPPDLSENPPF
ncbi:tetratricopeptide repeat protein [Actinomadura rugatobispora]|uniref:Tetratricopeptide repeat protein n=1 Tax=Actinomadura rugatobispora TaxID=1994 RepID=A0ABW0ZWQ7_9ACTN